MSYIVGSKLLRSQVLQPGIRVLRTLFAPTARLNIWLNTSGAQRSCTSVNKRAFITLPSLSRSFETQRPVSEAPKLARSQSRMPIDFHLGKPCEGLPTSVPFRSITCVPPEMGTITSNSSSQVLFQVTPNDPYGVRRE